MQIDKQKINQILNMNERDFTEIVYTVVMNATGDMQKAKMAMGFAPLIREKLKYADAEDLEKIFELMGEEKMRGILRSLGS